MEYYNLDFFGLKRKLPLVSLTPKIKVASLSLLGDTELTDKAAEKLKEKLEKYHFDYLVGPEVKVVPLLYALSQKFGQKRYIVCRKSIKGYMNDPFFLKTPQGVKSNFLVLDGPDAELLPGKKVAVIDDVVSSGTTLTNLENLLKQAGAEIEVVATIFKQGDKYEKDLLFLSSLPVFFNQLPLDKKT